MTTRAEIRQARRTSIPGRSRPGCTTCSSTATTARWARRRSRSTRHPDDVRAATHVEGMWVATPRNMRKIAIAIALTACGHPVPHTDPHDRLADGPHATPVRTATVEPDVVERRHGQHIDDLRMIERDLIAGRLDEARTLGYLLAQPPEPWMSPWPFDTAYVEAAALDLVTAPDLEAAYRSEARLAAAC